MGNLFINDTERILELKSCLEKSYEILQNSDDVVSSHDTVRTLIRDTLSRYKEDKKFVTANTSRSGPLEFLED